MTTSASNIRCAVRVGETEVECRAIDAFLADRGLLDVTHFLPKDDDDLADALAQTRFDCVVFADFEALLSMIWKGDAELEQWKTLGIRVELAARPDGETGDWQTQARRMCASFDQWQARHGKRQVIAALILSVIALLAIAALLYIIPPPRPPALPEVGTAGASAAIPPAEPGAGGKVSRTPPRGNGAPTLAAGGKSENTTALLRNAERGKDA